MPFRDLVPEDQRRAGKAIHGARKKVREAMFCHRWVLLDPEVEALEGCLTALMDIERRLGQAPVSEDYFR